MFIYIYILYIQGIWELAVIFFLSVYFLKDSFYKEIYLNVWAAKKSY